MTISLRLAGPIAVLAASLLGACSAERGGGTLTPTDLGTIDLAMPIAPDLSQPVVGGDVHVVLTADNAYAFGWGDVNQVTSLKGRPPTSSAGDIFNCPIGTGPEAYDVPGAEAPADGYLYVVTWADDSTTQGLIGQFERGGTPLYTGDTAWETCATGLPYDPSGSGTMNGPTQAVVNAQIAMCNDGTISKSTGSGGWVGTAGAVTAGAVGKLAVGEDNTTGGDFPVVCQMDATGKKGVDTGARWMWYQPPGVTNPFIATGSNSTRAFLIFRLKSAAVPIL